jgi:uncharacterized phage infection (PIP) family protein YhgE
MNMMALPPSAWLLGACGLALGATLTGCVTWWVMRRRAAAWQARLVVSARDQLNQGLQGLRTNNAKLMAELDKEREAAQKGKLTQANDQRGLVLHLQSQLRAANMELDRLQRAHPVVTAAAAPQDASQSQDAVDTQGFALTRPFER